MNFLLRTPFIRLFFAVAAGIVIYQFVRLPSFVITSLFALAIFVIAFSFFIQFKMVSLLGIGKCFEEHAVKIATRVKIPMMDLITFFEVTFIFIVFIKKTSITNKCCMCNCAVAFR